MHAGPAAGVAHRLAGGPADQDIGFGKCGLVDGGDVAQVGDAGGVERFDGDRPGLQVGGDDGVRAAQGSGDAHVQAAVPGEQGDEFWFGHTRAYASGTALFRHCRRADGNAPAGFGAS